MRKDITVERQIGVSFQALTSRMRRYVFYLDQTTNLGVRSSNLFGRASCVFIEA